jgi:hypothetical protein
LECILFFRAILKIESRSNKNKNKKNCRKNQRLEFLIFFK